MINKTYLTRAVLAAFLLAVAGCSTMDKVNNGLSSINRTLDAGDKVESTGKRIGDTYTRVKDKLTPTTTSKKSKSKHYKHR